MVKIVQYFGFYYQDFFKIKIDKKGNFELKGILLNFDYYVFCVGNQYVNFILCDGVDIKLYCDGKNIVVFINVVGFDEMVVLNEFVVNMQMYNVKCDLVIMYL